MNEKDISKLIWSKEAALKENLLLTEEAKEIQETIIAFLDSVLDTNSLPGLRYRRLKNGNQLKTWWSTNGYPTDGGWNKIKPLVDIFEQYLAEKTIKNRIKDDEFFIESRRQGEDEHILVGKRDGSGSKAHIVIDGTTGEIRVEDNQQAPEEVISKIQTILTLPNGKKIQSTREVLEFIAD